MKQTYQALLEKLGNEFQILHYLDRDIIESAGVPLLGEAITRMRDNRVSFSPGYDGIFGTVKIFSDQERNRLLGQRSLFSSFEKKVGLIVADKGATPQPSSDHSPYSAVPEPIEGVEPLVQLNNEQQAAVDHQKGHLMIIAGPGTGKTRTLTHKMARLIETGVDVDRLLAVTFTNKAANEMKDRLCVLLGGKRSLPFVGTFHALGYQILRQLKGNTVLSVIDEKTRKALLHDAFDLNGLSRKENGLSVEDLMGWVVTAKQKMLFKNDPMDGVCPQQHRSHFIRCYDTYQHLLKINGLADFEDLIFRTVQLLENDSCIRDQYAGRFRYLFIDEYQDINPGQYRLVKLLTGKQANVCIIGDPDQAIYGFRGSDSECFKWFYKEYTDVRTVFLKRNYRSTQTILDVSAQVIQHNPGLNDRIHRQAVYSHMAGDKTIHIIETATENAEAVAIGKTIEKMVGGTGFFSLDSGAVDGSLAQETLSFADFAVLFRTRNQGKVFFKTLGKAGIPCQLVDRQTVIDHIGIKAVLSVFKLLREMGLFIDLEVAAKEFKPSLSSKVLELFKSWAYQNHLTLKEALIQARRLPIPHMGRVRQQQLYDYTGQLLNFKKQTDGLSVAETLEWIVEKDDLKEKFSADQTFESGYQQILQAAKGYPADAQAFLSAVALSSNTDVYDQRVEKVALITMHAAKGLEFPVVFIAGCEDEYIPYRSVTRPSDVEEERRLFYVALTRAKKHLFLSKADRRMVHGKIQMRQLSPFVKEFKNSYKRFSGHGGKKKDPPAQKQLSLF